MSSTHFKLPYGEQEELLTRLNYHTWAETMKMHLTWAGLWRYVTNEYHPIRPLPDNPTYFDQFHFIEAEEALRKKKYEAYCFISRACSKDIRSRYLIRGEVHDAATAWNTLKTALGGEDNHKNSILVSRFMAMKKPHNMAMREFAQQLLTIQKETSKEVTNPDGSTEFVSTVLPDCMVHIRIFLNASPEHASLTECLSTVKNKLPLSIVLDLYEAAEEAHAARTIAQKGQVRRGYRSKPY